MDKQLIVTLFSSEGGAFKKFFDKNVNKLKLKNVNYVSFDTESLKYFYTDTELNLKDNIGNDLTISLSDAQRIMVFQRGNTFEKFPYIYRLLNYMKMKKFILINDLDYEMLSSDKYQLYLKLKEAGVPQPKSILLTPSDLGEDANSETINKKLCEIYPKPKDDNEYVVKILDGFGGTGVFMINHKNLLSVMQTLSKIDPNRSFIVQDKKNGKNGDIRVHVFTLYDKQFILCSVKRVRLGNDFRSNICLGATIKPIKLSKEQEKIALAVGKASGLVWCGVDIMETEEGDNFVLEYNTEAGALIDYMNATGKDVFGPMIEQLTDICQAKKINEGLIYESNVNKVDTYKSNYNIKHIVYICKNDKAKQDLGEYIMKFCKVNPDVKYTFIKVDEVSYQHNGDTFNIKTKSEHLKLTKEDIKTTLILTRESILRNDVAGRLSDDLEAKGFIVMNSAKHSKPADDKYEMAKLFKKNNIPAPRGKLLTFKDIDKDNVDINKLLVDIYPEIKTNSDKENEQLQYVVKILNGCGGTGVSMTNGKFILGMLQTIFAIDKDRKLLVQRFEKGKGGDLRVHVITLNGQQKIIASMKRNQLDKDFRSNVSLGASTSVIKLTKDQEQIALDVANASKMPWCAVDIMPIEKNRDGQENVVLEYNNSAGVEGICGLTKTNIVNLIMDAIDELSK